MDFFLDEIMPLIDKNENQSTLLNELIRKISQKIFDEMKDNFVLTKTERE